MADLVFSGGPSITFSPSAGLDAAASGKFWLDDKAGEKIYGRVEHEFPGLAGVAVKWTGFRGRALAALVAYKNTTAALIKSAWETDSAALGNRLFTVALPDHAASFPNVALAAPDGFPCGPIQPLLGGSWIMITTIQMRQMYEGT